MIHVCCPCLRRYDLLVNMVASLREECWIHVIDNGLDSHRAASAMNASQWHFEVHHPHIPMGVAESWNWFIENVPEERVICNDDVTFAPDSLAKLTASTADLVFAQGCGFSCFVIRDSAVRKIGVFDESISPGYGYYEDEDYLQRLNGKGTRKPSATAEDVPCGVVHLNSQTLATYSDAEMTEHHRKFHIARANYMAKWKLATL